MAVAEPPGTKASAFDWPALVRVSGIVLVLMLAAVAVGLRDVESAAVAAGGIVALLLLRLRTGLVGLVALGVSFTNVAVWMLPASASNLAHGEPWVATAIPAALAATALVGLAGVVACLVRRRLPGQSGRAPAAVGIVGLALVAAASGVAAVGSGGGVEAAGDLRVDMGQVRFDPERLDADAGIVVVVVSNSDLFWHTFTIRELDVNVNVPVRGERRLEFEAPPGTYEVVCTIPGHEQAGMTGTLAVG